MRNNTAYLLLAGVGVCASILILWMTACGPGVSPDSALYMATARNLLEGKGFHAGPLPFTHWPPGYPILLAGAGFMIPDMVQASRVLGAVFFGVNIALIGIMVQLCTGRSLTAVLCATLFPLFSAPVLALHSMAWSEAPFIACTYSALICISIHLSRPDRRLLIAGAILAGYAMATRYIGIILLPAIGIGILLLSNRRVRERLKDGLLFGIVSAIPLGCWMIRNMVITARPTSREFAVHLISLDLLKRMVDTFYDFAMPIQHFSELNRSVQLGFLFGIMGMGYVAGWRGDRVAPAKSLPFILTSMFAIFAFSYTAFLVFSICFFDAYAITDSRMLMPALLAVLMICVSIAWHASKAAGRKVIWHGFVVFLIVSMVVNAPEAYEVVAQRHGNGHGYTLRSQNMDALLDLQKMRKGEKIYSNAADYIYFKTGIEAAELPAKYEFTSNKPNAEYDAQMRQVARDVVEERARVVYLSMFEYRAYMPNGSEIQSQYGMPVLKRFSGDVIYGREVETNRNIP